MTTYPLTIYFDGSCKLCRSEIANIAARDLEHRLHMVDCSASNFDDGGLPVKRDTLMHMIHARDAAGHWSRGVDVFIDAYRAAGLGWVSRILRMPGLRPLADRAYPWLVRNRHRVSTLGLHHLLNYFTHRAQDRRAGIALARSQSCRNHDCLR